MFRIEGITKVFPGVRALDDVTVTFKPGEVHSIMGENGAGKSTLLKVLTGIYMPDEGAIYKDDKRLKITCYDDAIKNGISIANQEIQIIPESTVAENMALDKLHLYTKHGIIDWKRLFKECRKYFDYVGLDVDPKEKCGLLSAAKKQLLQIAKAISNEAQLLLLDEPTSSLTPVETERLYSIIHDLKKRGIAIVFISHKIEEVQRISDIITVFKDGKVSGSIRSEEFSKEKIVRLMINRNTNDDSLGTLPVNYNNNVLEVSHLSQMGRFKDISFSLKKGEILGFYGLVGAGRTELAKIIIGEDRKDGGEIKLNGKPVDIKGLSDCIRNYKIGYITENRKEQGLFLNASILSNFTICSLYSVLKASKFGIDIKKEKNNALKMADKLSLKYSSLDQEARNLSGGNQQKICMGKWLLADCEILIIDEPTVGVDVGAKESIHQLIWELAKKENKSIILISSDMPELVRLSKRILVFKEFEISGEIDDINVENVKAEEVYARIGSYIM